MRQATAAEEAAAYVSRYRWIILLGLITAAIMEVLDTTIINVALPQMAGLTHRMKPGFMRTRASIVANRLLKRTIFTRPVMQM